MPIRLRQNVPEASEDHVFDPLRTDPFSSRPCLTNSVAVLEPLTQATAIPFVEVIPISDGPFLNIACLSATGAASIVSS